MIGRVLNRSDHKFTRDAIDPAIRPRPAISKKLFKVMRSKSSFLIVLTRRPPELLSQIRIAKCSDARLRRG